MRLALCARGELPLSDGADVLAERFGVSAATIGRILRRETWVAPEYE